LILYHYSLTLANSTVSANNGTGIIVSASNGVVSGAIISGNIVAGNGGARISARGDSTVTSNDLIYATVEMVNIAEYYCI
jgi:hypothetical protein